MNNQKKKALFTGVLLTLGSIGLWLSGIDQPARPPVLPAPLPSASPRNTVPAPSPCPTPSAEPHTAEAFEVLVSQHFDAAKQEVRRCETLLDSLSLDSEQGLNQAIHAMGSPDLFPIARAQAFALIPEGTAWPDLYGKISTQLTDLELCSVGKRHALINAAMNHLSKINDQELKKEALFIVRNYLVQQVNSAPTLGELGDTLGWIHRAIDLEVFPKEINAHFDEIERSLIKTQTDLMNEVQKKIQAHKINLSNPSEKDLALLYTHSSLQVEQAGQFREKIEQLLRESVEPR